MNAQHEQALQELRGQLSEEHDELAVFKAKLDDVKVSLEDKETEMKVVNEQLADEKSPCCRRRIISMN